MSTISLDNVNRQMFEAMMNEINAAGGVNVTGKINGTTASLTIVDANGAQKVVEIALPDLDKPDAECGQVNWNVLESKLSSVMNDHQGGKLTTSYRIPTDTFADMYAIFSLLLKVAQKLRQSGAEMKAASHKQLQASLANEAATIKTNAETAYSQAWSGALASAITTGISGALTIGSLGLEIRATCKSNLGETGKKLDGLQNQMDSVSKATPNEKVSFGLEQELLFGEQGGKNMQPLSEQEVFQRLGQKSGQIAGVKDNVANAQNNVQPQEQPVITEQTNKARTEFEKASNDVKARKETLANSEKQMEVAQEKYNQDPTNPELKEAYEKASAQVERDKTALDKAKATCADKAIAYRDSVKSDLAAFLDRKGAGKLSKALTKMNMLPYDNEKKQAVDAANKVQKSVDGRVRESIIEGLGSRLKEAKADHSREYKLVLNSGKMRVASGFEHVGQMSKQIGETVNAFSRANSDRVQAMGQAVAKTKEAEQESIRARIDQFKETYDQEGELLRTVQETIKEINRAEHESLTAAMNV